jgi:hypothetical protein
MPGMPNINTRYVAFMCTPAQAAALKAEAAKHERTLSAELRLMLRRHLEVLEAETPDPPRALPESSVDEEPARSEI